MLAYTIRRLLLIIPTMILVTMIVFLSVRFIPGSVVDMMVSQMSSQGGVSKLTVDTLRKNMGLDVPLYLQYVRWLGVAPQETGGFHGLIEGDLGKSLWKQQDVTSLIAERLPVTFELGVIAIITALLSSIPLGIYSAIRQDTWGDYVGRTAVDTIYFSARLLAGDNGDGIPLHLVGFGSVSGLYSIPPESSAKPGPVPYSRLHHGFDHGRHAHENDSYHDAGSAQTGLH